MNVLQLKRKLKVWRRRLEVLENDETYKEHEFARIIFRSIYKRQIRNINRAIALQTRG